MLDMKALLSEFTTHVTSMTDDDVRASIQNAERLTAGCSSEVGDISEYDLASSNETESKSISIDYTSPKTYSFISMYSADSRNSVATWVWGEADAA